MIIHNLSENNSILNHFVSELRDVNIQNDSLRFRKNLQRIGEVMAYEISKTLHYRTHPIQTPLGVAIPQLSIDQIVLAAILRAALPLQEGFLSYFDQAQNAFISAYRNYSEDHHSFDVVVEYLSSPRIDGKTLVIIDTMLATGQSVYNAYQALLKKGEPACIHVACAIASQQGIAYLRDNMPQKITTIWAADVDPDLNEFAYIVPGLGDAGDLAYGIKE